MILPITSACPSICKAENIGGSIGGSYCGVVPAQLQNEWRRWLVSKTRIKAAFRIKVE